MASSALPAPCGLRPLMALTDVGFVAYWLVTALGLVPPELAYQDYRNPLLVAWNWSFLPLDLLASATGFAALAARARSRAGWAPLALVSLTLTSVAGLQAVAFWALRGEFDPAWWLPNLFLLAYPWLFLPSLLRASR